jgi:hypothetical protein
MNPNTLTSDPIYTHKHTGTDSSQFPFTNLSDVPNSYNGKSGQIATVNSTESGLTFSAAGSLNLSVEDGSTTVTPVSVIKFTSGATVTNAGGGEANVAVSASGGTVTTVSVVTANGISGSVANPTTTPAITLSLGAITPTKITATVVSMSAQALNGTAGNVFTRTLAGSETFTQSGFTTGQCFMVEVTQGSGTSYTVNWFSGITWVATGSFAPVQTTTSNGITTYGFRCIGSNLFLGYLIGTQ